MEIDGPSLAEPAKPLDRLVVPGLAADPEAVAVESAYRRLTWAELEGESARLAADYLSLGLEEMPLNPTGKIDRVGLKRTAEEHLDIAAGTRTVTERQD